MLSKSRLLDKPLDEEFVELGALTTHTVQKLSCRKPCGFCHVTRPPLQSHHCKLCYNCVATCDQHCTFLHTCIGERNHVRFWIFVFLNVVAIRILLQECHFFRVWSHDTFTLLFFKRMSITTRTSTPKRILPGYTFHLWSWR